MVNYYVCATPYHIINSILIRNNYFDADYNIMLLTENCRNADQLLGLMEQENIFDECIYIDDSILKKTEESFVKHYKKLLKSYLNDSMID